MGPWVCALCGQTLPGNEADAIEHGRSCGEPPPPVPIEVAPVANPTGLAELELATMRQTAALEVLAVQLTSVAKSLERLAYRARSIGE